jgi:proline iminopeptidase
MNDIRLAAPRTALFPEIEPRRSGMLPVDALHTLYWEESGNPDGIPVVFLHGGPGAGAGAAHRRFFDPERYQIVIFDQRGAGRSTPLGSLVDNTTPHLVADIERLREFLGVDRWLVFGGSWGSTLALAYGESHPDRCLGFILRGIFLCRPSEIEWFLYGVRSVFPDVWAAFSGFIPEAERGDLLSAYRRRLEDPDPAVHMPAAREWSLFEGACSTLLPSEDAMRHFGDDVVALGLARIEAHYFAHDIFLQAGSLLDRVDRIRHLPCVIVQGRYDMVCPAVSAFDLAARWPEADFQLISDAGHSAWEPGIRSALVAATEQFHRTRPWDKERPVMQEAPPPVLLRYMAGLRAHDVPAILDTVSDDLRFESQARILDKSAFRGMLTALYTGFPDWHYDNDPPGREGDWWYVLWRQSGNHGGTFALPGMAPIPATGRPVKIPPQRFYYRVENDRIVVIRPDPIEGGAPRGILQQIGVEQPPL